jgi:hypothetical protein
MEHHRNTVMYSSTLTFQTSHCFLRFFMAESYHISVSNRIIWKNSRTPLQLLNTCMTRFPIASVLVCCLISCAPTPHSYYSVKPMLSRSSHLVVPPHPLIVSCPQSLMFLDNMDSGSSWCWIYAILWWFHVISNILSRDSVTSSDIHKQHMDPKTYQVIQIQNITSKRCILEYAKYRRSPIISQNFEP